MKPNETWRERFDEQFGRDSDPEEKGSIGQYAGCDDCFSNREERRRHKEFVATEIQRAVELEHNEWHTALIHLTKERRDRIIQVKETLEHIRN